MIKQWNQTIESETVNLRILFDIYIWIIPIHLSSSLLQFWLKTFKYSRVTMACMTQ